MRIRYDSTRVRKGIYAQRSSTTSCEGDRWFRRIVDIAIQYTMQSKIREILAKIETLNSELRDEYERLLEKYGFSFQKKKIIFLEEFKRRNKSLKLPLWRPITSTNLRQIIAIPFILGMIFPAIVLDIGITIYQAIAFSLYDIPKVKRSDYIIYERRFLDYLNFQHKLQCLYCSYVNGLFAYSVEIAARTERYWCPLKAAHKPRFSHDWYKDFADYGNPEEWKDKFSDESKAFKDVYGDIVLVK